MGLHTQSAGYVRAFFMTLSSDHITGATGKTVTVTISKGGGAFAAAGGAVTEISSGWYYISLTTTDTNTLGDLAFHCTASGCDATDFADQILAFDLFSTSWMSTLASAIWIMATSTLAGGGYAGSVGQLITTNLNATVTSRQPSGNVTVASNLDKTGYELTNADHVNIIANVDSALDAAGSELSAVPSTTGSLRQKINFLFEYFRNKRTVTSSQETLLKEDASTTLGTSTITDDGTTFTKGEMN